MVCMVGFLGLISLIFFNHFNLHLLLYVPLSSRCPVGMPLFVPFFFCFLRNMTLKGTSHMLLDPKVSVLFLHFSSSIFVFCMLLFLCPFLCFAFIFFHVGFVQSGLSVKESDIFDFCFLPVNIMF
ncbi:hypothetical protein I3760_03G016600 [Carya illinoinensis]|nr:hypothetical protein I3760_03G016600 [Carya illinoinensis]